MIQFMGRENTEDYNTDFLTMLETWEAAAKYERAHARPFAVRPLEIAKTLGWVRPDKCGWSCPILGVRCHAGDVEGGKLSRGHCS